jgi:hypothetical protein
MPRPCWKDARDLVEVGSDGLDSCAVSVSDVRLCSNSNYCLSCADEEGSEGPAGSMVEELQLESCWPVVRATFFESASCTG